MVRPSYSGRAAGASALHHLGPRAPALQLERSTRARAFDFRVFPFLFLLPPLGLGGEGIGTQRWLAAGGRAALEKKKRRRKKTTEAKSNEPPLEAHPPDDLGE